MTLIKRLGPLVLFLSISSHIQSTFAQGKYEWKQVSAGGYNYKYVTNDPMQTRFYKLKNGLTVMLSPNKKEPRIAVKIAVRAGSNTDPKDHTGLAHYLEHLLFKGTDKFGSLDWNKEKPLLDKIEGLYEQYNATKDEDKRKEIYKEIDNVSGEASKYAIANEYDKLMTSIGAQGTNAHTWVEETVYEEDIPSNSIDKFLKIQAERFRNPIFRIFHTELEAVYEEKNRSLDNDGNKMNEAMHYYLFPTHNYGQQTTLGTIDHLKNPSLKAIREYYNQYYVPNNMSIIMSGDFNPDELVKKIDAQFAYMQPKPVAEYKPAAEQPITEAIVKDIYGPSAENMRICFRTPAEGTRDALMLQLISSILSNGTAGVFDLNLNKQQKLQSAGAGMQQYKDYGIFILFGTPKEGQSLEEVKKILISQLDVLKKGDFDEALIKAIVANAKLSEIQNLEQNGARANALMSAFISNKGEGWKQNVSSLDEQAKITKQEIVNYANKFFGEGYVVLYKRKGEDKNILKVEKPAITPVETNAGKQSDFVRMINNMPESPIKPQWLDFKKDIQKGKVGNADLFYAQNKENESFRLFYSFDMGSWNSKSLPLSAAYLSFLGTDKYTAEAISKEFYNIACSFSMNTSNEQTTISISGLHENFEKAVALFEHIIANCKADEDALISLKGRVMNDRANNKLSKEMIMYGLTSYATYGAKNPFNYTLSNEEVSKLKAEDLVGVLHNLMNYKHYLIYFGPKSKTEITASLLELHKMPAEFRTYDAGLKFERMKQMENKVLFADYDMVQSEIKWERNASKYDPAIEPTVDLFNGYFGGGMGSVVFQTIRESKALAYSTFAAMATPNKKEDPFSITAYVGCQSDKMNEAVSSMNELLNVLPLSEKAFDAAKKSLLQDIETQRITQDGPIGVYLAAQKKGLNYDIRKYKYETLQKLTFDNLRKLHQQELANKPYAYCVVASDKRVKVEDLNKIGKVNKLSLEDIFGY
ncbi:M16 family metallopeptidase [Pedobacter nyackensis]|uniref:Predicted Zn-dependent peptidase n=1 Tax=Pedobacter nyackensis TaxID=475255 RepID=A0A1W2DZD4_9SPHI|nr:M16 family metallopeptidase [Pedobacter nyackensis]SMD02871.1 Predicted Zn-dependent peptidase [Pedobacter nyackensis]